KREEFVMNAQLEMIPSPTIIGRFIVPQISSLLIVGVALSIPGTIIAETSLSWLGLGITEPSVSWGSMINRNVLTLAIMRAYPWLLAPIWFILAITLGFNFLGDALRDYFDPYNTVFPKFGKGKQMLGQDGGTAVHVGAGGLPLPAEEREERNAFLSVRDLKVSFFVRRGKAFVSIPAVRGISFDVEKGECLGIVGESGSGKSVSTIAIPKLLPGNARVEGSVKYEGRELTGLGTEALRQYRGRKIGMIFQEPGRSFDPLQSIGGAFIETFRNSEPKITKEEAFDKAAALLAETGLERGRERLMNYPHQFSGGQLQRIGIALALAQGCDFLIADEPTTALDVTIQKQIIELLKSLRQSRRISIIFISHDIDLVADISDRIMVMYGGMVMEAGSPEEITQRPRHPYTVALLASSPRFGSHYSLQRLTSIPGSPGDGLANQAGCPFAPRCTEAKDECRQQVPVLRVNGINEIRCVLKEGHHPEDDGLRRFA
ncbi:MAG: ATP-binding cassette domain-containing protein, partial [Treponema sp.]|nr:ATP-binding cassette domain-containing protein [Treponema sp.]